MTTIANEVVAQTTHANDTNSSNVTENSSKRPAITPDTSESGSDTSSKHVLAAFLADYSNTMSRQTSKRGKRRNAVDLFMSSTSSIQKAVKDEYDGVIFDNNNVDMTDIEIHLHAGTCTMEQFFIALGCITTMSEYLPTTLHEEGYPTPQTYIFSLIESYIFAQFLSFLQDVNCIQSLMVAAWIEDSTSKVELFCPSMKISPLWLSEHTKLTQNFLEEGVRSKTKHVLNLITTRWSDDINSTGPDNRYIVDLAFVIDEHIKIAKTMMKESFASSVMVICNEVMSIMVSEIMVDLCTKWMSIETCRMCYIIRDSSELSEILKERNDIYMDSDKSKETADQAIQDLHELSMLAIHLLSERMMYDLQHSVATLSTIGSPDWERDEKGTTVKIMLATYRSMLARVYNWLASSKYFPMFLKNAFNLTLQSYMESLYSNTMASGVMNPTIVATNLSRDYVNLVTFFNGSLFEQHQGREGFYTACEVNQRLQVIQCMARLINPEVSPSELEDDAAQLLALTSDSTDGDSSAAILHIAGLRSNACVEKSTEWLQMIETLEPSGNFGQNHQIDNLTLPDLRNSKYVRQMQQNHHSSNNETIHRHISTVLSFTGDSKVAFGKMIRKQARKVIGSEK